MRAITVLGMHRSGTSAITRALGLLGADMGPRGHLGQYWENRYLRRTNQRLLGDGGTWDNPPARHDGWKRGSKSQLTRAKRFVVQEFGDAPVIVWKDPRTCLTLPFWRRVFDEDPVIVLIHRHPTEVAGSLASRNQLGTGHVLAVWERYNADALRFSSGLPTVVIEYGQILSNPVGVVGSLVQTMRSWGVNLPNDPATTNLELSSDSRHHEATSNTDLDHPAATRSQRQLFSKLTKLEGGHAMFKPGRLPDPHPLSLEVLDLVRQRRVWQSQSGSEGAPSPAAVLPADADVSDGVTADLDDDAAMLDGDADDPEDDAALLDQLADIAAGDDLATAESL